MSTLFGIVVLALVAAVLLYFFVPSAKTFFNGLFVKVGILKPVPVVQTIAPPYPKPIPTTANSSSKVPPKA